MTSITVATTNAVVSLAGGRVNVQAGTAWIATDPVVLAYPHLFSDDERYLRRSDDLPVEAATAAPGERRDGVVKRGRRTAVKDDA